MAIVIYGLAALQLVFGGLVLSVASGAIHEATAAVLVAGGTIALGIARLVQLASAAEDRRKAAEHAAEVAEWKAR